MIQQGLSDVRVRTGHRFALEQRAKKICEAKRNSSLYHHLSEITFTELRQPTVVKISYFNDHRAKHAELTCAYARTSKRMHEHTNIGEHANICANTQTCTNTQMYAQTQTYARTRKRVREHGNLCGNICASAQTFAEHANIETHT